MSACSFENIGSDGIVQSSEIACDSAREALNTFGYWTGHIYTTGSHNCSSWASTRMLRMGNYRNYLSSVGSGYRRKIDIAKDIVKDIIERHEIEVVDVHSMGDEPLERMFSLIQLGDFTSYYLAIINEVDPTPVELIESLKKALAD